MTYARARLWLGITGVGAWTLIAVAGLWWPWSAPVATGSRFLDLVALVTLYAVIQAPFDWLGGFYLPKAFGRPATSFAAWARGVLVQAACWIMASTALCWSGESYGIAGAAVVSMLLMGTLMAAQGALAHATGRLRIVSRTAESVLVASDDPAFVGGWVGLGVARELWLPASWSPDARAVQQVRRQAVAANGARAAGVALALAFNLAGLLVSFAWTPGAGFASTDAYLRLVFGFTLWSFAGLLILPSLSRTAVFAADRAAAGQGMAWQPVARELDRLQDDEPERPTWVERIFHPVPALNARLRRAGHGGGTGAWQAARLALYTSWAVPGLLSRSVHCNVGRPDLWVLFPGD